MDLTLREAAGELVSALADDQRRFYRIRRELDRGDIQLSMRTRHSIERLVLALRDDPSWEQLVCEARDAVEVAEACRAPTLLVYERILAIAEAE